MTREELDFIGSMNMCDEISNEAYKKIVCHCEGQEPCEDTISRQAVINLIRGCNSALEEPRIFDSHNSGTIFEHYITELQSVNPQPCDFARWVAEEIFDDNWEYNKDAFAEIACRKLAKLGIVRANGDKWELAEPQEREVRNDATNKGRTESLS